MEIVNTPLSGVKLLKPERFTDQRGFFSETYNKERYSAVGINDNFVQDNHSVSSVISTLRGLHFQVPPHAQSKLVRCGRGAIYDVAVDIRTGSSTYGGWVGYELTAENGWQLYIPIGFAHGFVTLQSDSEIVYKCSNYYSPNDERSLHWNDPMIGIEWPIEGSPTLSLKDQQAKPLSELGSPFRSVV